MLTSHLLFSTASFKTVEVQRSSQDQVLASYKLWPLTWKKKLRVEDNVILRALRFVKNAYNEADA